MWCGWLLVAFLATGAQAFSSGPIRWGGRLGKKLFLAPTVPLDGIATPQQLTLKESSDSKVPFFTANQDHTISCDDNDMRWCLEAYGIEHGHVIRVNYCTGRPTQKWRWLPWGPIQLEGTNQCIFVNENDGVTTASVQLSECVNKASDTWTFEDTAPALARSSLQTLSFSNVSIGAAVMVAALGLGAWMWRWQKESAMVLASKASAPLAVDQGGVCLTGSIALRSNEITMAQGRDDEELWDSKFSAEDILRARRALEEQFQKDDQELQSSVDECQKKADQELQRSIDECPNFSKLKKCLTLDPALPPSELPPLLMNALRKNDFPDVDSGMRSMWEFAGDQVRFVYKNDLTEFIKDCHQTAAQFPTSFYGMAMNGGHWHMEGELRLVGGDPQQAWIATQVMQAYSSDGRMRRWKWELRKHRRPPDLGAWFVESIMSSDRKGVLVDESLWP